MKRVITSGARRLYEFGPFRLDVNRQHLLVNGQIIPLSRKAIEALTVLVQNRGKLLEREALMRAIWPEVIVEDANLTVAISQLRKAFNENCDTGEFIQTIPRVGYRFAADVCEVLEEPASLAIQDDRLHGISVENSEHYKAMPVENSRGCSEMIAEHGTPSIEDSRGPRTASRRYPARLVTLAAISMVALGVLFFVRYRSALTSTRALTGRTFSAAAQIPEKSIAVLPFENLTDEKENYYLAAGIQDETISDLATIADLKVISRTSANHYKSETARNSREVGQQLGVAYLLEGSLQRMGDQLRVHAQLIDARTDMHVWAQTYHGDVADLFAVQSEIAQEITRQLHVKISSATKRAIQQPPTADLSAFDLYTRGKNLFLAASGSDSGKQDLLLAVDLLNQAVARDPAFLQAYCQLVWTHDLLYILGHDHTPARLRLAEAALEAAFRLRPDAGEAHLAYAEHLYRGRLDYEGALAQLEMAHQSLPNDSHVFELKAAIERRQGKYENALRSFARDVDLDPRNILTLQQIALTYGYLRRYAEVEVTCDRALAIDPSDVQTKVGRAYLQLAWKANTEPLHQVIDSILATKPNAIRDIADYWLGCALAERDAVAAQNALVAAAQNPPLNDEAFHFNRGFVEGLIARMSKDESKARSAFAVARTEQEQVVQAQPDYGPPLCVLGLIDAGLGRKEEALREGRRAIELLPVEKDAINGPLVIEYSAMIAAWVGDTDLACEQLATAIRYPSSLSYGQLKLSPVWDPLRGDPRFEKIVASLAPKESAAPAE